MSATRRQRRVRDAPPTRGATRGARGWMRAGVSLATQSRAAARWCARTGVCRAARAGSSRPRVQGRVKSVRRTPPRSLAARVCRIACAPPGSRGRCAACVCGATRRTLRPATEPPMARAKHPPIPRSSSKDPRLRFPERSSSSS
eukprot:3592735-Rhodomonas_salina.2